MTENVLMICFGLLMFVLAFGPTKVSDRAMPPASKGRMYPATNALRLSLFLLGALAVILGVVRLLHR